MADYDLIIRNGRIVDGTGVPSFVGDLAIKDGCGRPYRRAPAGERRRGARRRGLVVAPGFIDLHTHYDAQIYWDPYCTISGWHGVTRSCSATAVSGSRRCGPRSASGRCSR